MNDLHKVALAGSAELAGALLSTGSMDIDERDLNAGNTALFYAAGLGHSRVVTLLLDFGANVSIAGNDGGTPLYVSAELGHTAVTKMLVDAGADLEASLSRSGHTPLHIAVEKGNSEVVSVLIEAGANPNSRRLNGTTPLIVAASGGHMEVVKILLHAKADPLLTVTHARSCLVALDVAAQNGHSEVVHKLIQQLGIEGCGEASGGIEALGRATMVDPHVDTMAVLADAGVVDATGAALRRAAGSGYEAPVKFLLRQGGPNSCTRAYANCRYDNGETPLVSAIGLFPGCSPSRRIVRLLIDAGANTTSNVRLTNPRDGVYFDGKPLDIATTLLLLKQVGGGTDATEEQLLQLEGVRRLLLTVEAVHATSWLWQNDIPSIVRCTRTTIATPTTSRRKLPLLRRNTGARRELLMALFRWGG